MIREVEFILYVRSQESAKEFYSNVLRKVPSLHVPGMTEFQLTPNTKLGLMPNNGIAKIITPILKHPNDSDVPKCELYLLVDAPLDYEARALANGATMISPYAKRDWGHDVVYLADRDNHVIAFAKQS